MNNPQRRKTPLRGVGLAGTALVVAACLVPAAGANAVTTVTTGNTAEWQVHDSAPPGLDTGSLRAVSDSEVDGFGNIFVRVSAAPEPRLNGEMMRGFGLTFDGTSEYESTAAVSLGDVEITRAISMDLLDDTARYFDSFTNTSDAAVTVDVSFGGSLGSGSDESQSLIRATSSGDTLISPEDTWTLAATTEEDVRPIGVAIGSPAPFEGAMVGTGNQERDPFTTPMAVEGHEANFYGYLNTLTIEPGETQSLARYVMVGDDAAGSQDSLSESLTNLVSAPDLSGLSDDEICSVSNWDFSTIEDAPECSGPVSLVMPAAPAAAVATTSASYDVLNKTIEELQADMTAGVTTSEEIVQAYLDRIRVYDSGQLGYHSFITVADTALDNARAADAARAAGETGELLGIPIAVKDLFDTYDMPTTGGTLALEGYQPDHDAYQVAQLRDAGAIIIGKANLSEFASSGSRSESGYGQVWNALYPSKTSFGSSGGSAVSVAASFAAGSLGTQTGVSLYAPTVGSSLTTFRGTDGMSSDTGVMPLSWGQDYAGPIARTVTDLAYLLNATTGTDPQDPLTVEADERRPADWTDSLEVTALDGVRVGFLPDSFVSSFADDNTGAAVQAQFSALEAAGATMVELSDEPARPSSPSGSRTAEGWARYIEKQNGLFPFADGNELRADSRVLPYNQRDRDDERMTDEEVDAWLQYRADYKELIGDWMAESDVDVIVYAGFLSDVYNNDGNSTQHSADRSTGVLTSNVGLPTVVVPVGVNEHGYSIAMQLVGTAWSDAEVLGMGYALEQETQGQLLATSAPALAYDGSPVPTPTPTPTPTPEEPTDPEEPAEPDEPASGLSLALSASSVVAGDKLVVDASGLSAGETVEVWLHSDPVRLASMVATDESLSITVTIPTDTASGDHEIEVRTAGASAFADLEVTGGVDAAGLAFTGSAVAGWLVPISVSLLLAGGLALLLKRRLRRN